MTIRYGRSSAKVFWKNVYCQTNQSDYFRVIIDKNGRYTCIKAIAVVNSAQTDAASVTREIVDHPKSLTIHLYAPNLRF